jgi:hypothetical protein
MSTGQRNRGTVFRYFAVDTVFLVNNVRLFRYFDEFAVP